MRQSQLFTKTSKNFPEGEETNNARFLIKGGFISKSSAGVYSILPLGLRVLNKIVQVIREEMNALGAEELFLPALIDRRYWEKSGRWDTEIIYKTGKNLAENRHDFSAKGGSLPVRQAGASGGEYGLGWTHEEVVAAMAANFIQSYKDLPKGVYQFQTKFRAETRAQGGLLRGREFLMKDLYSFHKDAEDLENYYWQTAGAYKKIFKRLGLKTIVVEASGGDFTREYTHEFQVLNPAGEDDVFYCQNCDFAQNKEIYKKGNHKDCGGEVIEGRGIEVGNIFRLGTRFSEAFDLYYLNQVGKKLPIYMGSYGIGPTRVMGTLVEEYHDELGIIWPIAVAPFKVHLMTIKNSAKKTAPVYAALQKAGLEVLYDDRENASPGEKFADADLLGIPYRAVVSPKTLPKIELKRRGEEKLRMVTIKELIKMTAVK